jgi:hypothetical protein
MQGQQTTLLHRLRWTGRPAQKDLARTYSLNMMVSTSLFLAQNVMNLGDFSPEIPL